MENMNIFTSPTSALAGPPKEWCHVVASLQNSIDLHSDSSVGVHQGFLDASLSSPDTLLIIGFLDQPPGVQSL